MKKTKIAICYSGQLERVVDYPHAMLNQIDKLKNYDNCDLFFSHWDIDIPVEQYLFYLNDSLAKNNFKNVNVIKVEFTPLYKWDSKFTQSNCWSVSNSPNSIFLMYAGIKNVDLLRQKHELDNKFVYDLVLKSRLDIELVGEIDLKNLKKIIETKKATIFPKNFNWFEYWTDIGMLNDQFFASNSKNMTFITDLINHINEYVESGCHFHPESLLWWHIKKHLEIPTEYFGKNPWDKFPWYSFQNFETILRGSTGW